MNGNMSARHGSRSNYSHPHAHVDSQSPMIHPPMQHVVQHHPACSMNMEHQVNHRNFNNMKPNHHIVQQPVHHQYVAPHPQPPLLPQQQQQAMPSSYAPLYYEYLHETQVQQVYRQHQPHQLLHGSCAASCTETHSQSTPTQPTSMHAMRGGLPLHVPVPVRPDNLPPAGPSRPMLEEFLAQNAACIDAYSSPESEPPGWPAQSEENHRIRLAAMYQQRPKSAEPPMTRSLPNRTRMSATPPHQQHHIMYHPADILRDLRELRLPTAEELQLQDDFSIILPPADSFSLKDDTYSPTEDRHPAFGNENKEPPHAPQLKRKCVNAAADSGPSLQMHIGGLNVPVNLETSSSDSSGSRSSPITSPILPSAKPICTCGDGGGSKTQIAPKPAQYSSSEDEEDGKDGSDEGSISSLLDLADYGKRRRRRRRAHSSDEEEAESSLPSAVINGVQPPPAPVIVESKPLDLRSALSSGSSSEDIPASLNGDIYEQALELSSLEAASGSNGSQGIDDNDDESSSSGDDDQDYEDNVDPLSELESLAPDAPELDEDDEAFEEQAASAVLDALDVDSLLSSVEGGPLILPFADEVVEGDQHVVSSSNSSCDQSSSDAPLAAQESDSCAGGSIDSPCRVPASVTSTPSPLSGSIDSPQHLPVSSPSPTPSVTSSGSSSSSSTSSCSSGLLLVNPESDDSPLHGTAPPLPESPRRAPPPPPPSVPPPPPPVYRPLPPLPSLRPRHEDLPTLQEEDDGNDTPKRLSRDLDNIESEAEKRRPAPPPLPPKPKKVPPPIAPKPEKFNASKPLPPAPLPASEALVYNPSFVPAEHSPTAETATVKSVEVAPAGFEVVNIDGDSDEDGQAVQAPLSTVEEEEDLDEVLEEQPEAVAGSSLASTPSFPPPPSVADLADAGGVAVMELSQISCDYSETDSTRTIKCSAATVTEMGDVTCVTRCVTTTTTVNCNLAETLTTRPLPLEEDFNFFSNPYASDGPV